MTIDNGQWVALGRRAVNGNLLELFGIVLSFACGLEFEKPCAQLCFALRKSFGRGQAVPGCVSLQAETFRTAEHSVDQYRRTVGTMKISGMTERFDALEVKFSRVCEFQNCY